MGPETVGVAVSLNGQDFVTADLPFRFYSEPDVLGISPDAGPPGGGTAITIYGRGFPDTGIAVCRFGTVDANATTVSTA
eukprot:3937-Eustigmatos_ZCMA.PRE.1